MAMRLTIRHYERRTLASPGSIRASRSYGERASRLRYIRERCGRFKIGQLTDVSRCNLQQYFLCNQHPGPSVSCPGLARGVAQADWRCP